MMVIIGTDQQGYWVHLSERVEGTYIIGKTRMGKTTLMLTMILDDLAQGEGVCVVDPHGDLIDDIVARMPKDRYNDVILFDAGCDDIPPGFDLFTMLGKPTPANRSRHINRTVSAFEKTVGRAWGDRLENMIRLTAITFLDNPGNTLTEMEDLLLDPEFRRRMLPKLTHDAARRHWERVETMSDAALREYTESTMTRIRRFIYDPLIYNIVGQQGAGIDFRWAMDHRKVVLIKLATGKIDEKNVTMLGTFLVDRLLSAAMSREEIPLESRVPFYVYVDEYQNFLTPDFGTFFTQAGKYKIALTVAHQGRWQLPEDLKEAPLSANNLIAFTLNHDDGRALARGLDAPAGMGGLPPWREDEYVWPEPPPVKMTMQPLVVQPVQQIAPVNPWQTLKKPGHPDTDIALAGQRVRQAFSVLMRRRLAEVYACNSYYEAGTYGRESILRTPHLDEAEKANFESHWGEIEALGDTFLVQLGNGDTFSAWNHSFKQIRARAYTFLMPSERMFVLRSDAGRQYLDEAGHTTAGEILAERFLKELEALGRRWERYYAWEEPEPEPMWEEEEEVWDPQPEYRGVDLPRALTAQPRYHAFVKLLTDDDGFWEDWVQTPTREDLPPVIATPARVAALMDHWHRLMGLPVERVDEQIAARRRPIWTEPTETGVLEDLPPQVRRR